MTIENMTRWSLVVGVGLAGLLAGCGTSGEGQTRREQLAPQGDGGLTVAAGALVEARVGHAAAPIGSGILITGGRTLTAPTGAATAEVYDPDQGFSRPLTAFMSSARSGHVAVALADGRVWIAGGQDSQGVPLRGTELYDPAQNRFVAGPDLAQGQAEASAIVDDQGRVLIAGPTTVERWSQDLELIDVTPLAGGPFRGASIVQAGQGLYYLGGATDGEGRPRPGVWVEAGVGVFPSDGDLVLGGAPVLTATAGEARQPLLVGGRLQSTGQPILRFQVLEPRRPAAQGPSAPPTADALPAPDGIPGARARQGDRPRPVTLDRRHSLVQTRERPAVVALPVGVLVVGGELNGQLLDSVELISPRGNFAVTQLQAPRRDPVVIALPDGRAAITGGLGRDGLPAAQVELFLPPGSQAPDALGVFADEAAREAEERRLRAEVARLDAELAQANARIEQQQALIADLEAQLRRTEAILRQATEDLEDARIRVGQLTDENTTLSQDLARRDQEVLALNARVQELRDQRDDARSVLSILQIGASATAGQSAAANSALAGFGGGGFGGGGFGGGGFGFGGAPGVPAPPSGGRLTGTATPLPPRTQLTGTLTPASTPGFDATVGAPDPQLDAVAGQLSRNPDGSIR
jgi:Galactose oxidase, central domain/Csm1 N-terminal domain